MKKLASYPVEQEDKLLCNNHTIVSPFSHEIKPLSSPRKHLRHCCTGLDHRTVRIALCRNALRRMDYFYFVLFSLLFRPYKSLTLGREVLA